ncbi:MAG: hypothetical protein ABIT08_01095 [Bacteroidia bacterium]
MTLKKIIYQPLKLFPYSYAADDIYLKDTWLARHKENFNTVFIGSSHVFRQFETPLFDSLIRFGEQPVKSFNYGIQGLAASELFYLSDHLVKKNPAIKYLMIELTKITFPDHVNLHTTRMFYWYNYQTYLFTLKAIFDSKNTNFPLKGAIATMHTIGLIDKCLNFGFISDINNFYSRNEKVKNKISSMSTYNGFAPRKEIYPKQSDTNGINIRSKASAEQFQKYENNPELLKNYNKEYLIKINEIINDYSKKGIQVIFVIAPRADKDQYDEVIPLLAQIDARNKIEIADSRKYPEFYSLDNSADQTHLNKKGSRIFTTVLANEFNKLVETNSSEKNLSQ